MSTFVLVTDGRPAVQYKLNVTPSTPLTEVLSSACQKLKLQPDLHGLKRDNKPLDLSLSFRLAGIPQGSRLLVYRLPSSSSTATVLVAVQLVESGARISAKYPISTSIWSILKSAERQSHSEGKPINIIERAEPQPASGKNEGAGRLYYVRPVVQVLSRELSDLNDLKLSLKSLGITKGTALLRVKFEKTMVPLEQALEEIEKAFPEEKVQEEVAKVETIQTIQKEKTKEGQLIDFEMEDPPKTEETTDCPVKTEEPAPTPFQGVTVFKPSASETPQAALASQYDESDYEVTVSQAKLAQRHLEEAGRGQRLPSDKEIANKARERDEKARAANLVIRVRFPDQMIVEKSFKGTDTARSLYEFVKTVIRHPEEEFSLYLSPPHRTIPKDDNSLFIKHGFSSRTLVNFVWKDTTPDKVKSLPALTEAYVDTAKDIPIPEEVELKKEEGEVRKEEAKRKPAGGGGRGDGVAKKLPKWMTLGRK